MRYAEQRPHVTSESCMHQILMCAVRYAERRSIRHFRVEFAANAHSKVKRSQSDAIYSESTLTPLVFAVHRIFVLLCSCSVSVHSELADQYTTLCAHILVSL